MASITRRGGRPLGGTRITRSRPHLGLWSAGVALGLLALGCGKQAADEVAPATAQGAQQAATPASAGGAADAPATPIPSNAASKAAASTTNVAASTTKVVASPGATAALKRGAPGQPLLFRLRDALKALGMDVRGIQQDERAVRVTLEASAHDQDDDALLLSWAKAFGVLSHAGSPTVVLQIELGGTPTMQLEAETAEIRAVTAGKRSVRDFMASVRLRAEAAEAAAAAPAPAAVAPAAARPAATRPAAAAPASSRARASGATSRPSGRVSRPSGAPAGSSRGSGPQRPSRPSR